IDVSVSTDSALFSYFVSYWMMTYFPSGAPGAFPVYVFDLSLRETTRPRGPRTAFTCCFQASWGTAPLKRDEASVQESPYFPASTSWSHAVALASAAVSSSA